MPRYLLSQLDISSVTNSFYFSFDRNSASIKSLCIIFAQEPSLQYKWMCGALRGERLSCLTRTQNLKTYEFFLCANMWFNTFADRWNPMLTLILHIVWWKQQPDGPLPCFLSTLLLSANELPRPPAMEPSALKQSPSISRCWHQLCQPVDGLCCNTQACTDCKPASFAFQNPPSVNFPCMLTAIPEDLKLM